VISAADVIYVAARRMHLVTDSTLRLSKKKNRFQHASVEANAIQRPGQNRAYSFIHSFIHSLIHGLFVWICE
jgi:hypothetical protein